MEQFDLKFEAGSAKVLTASASQRTITGSIVEYGVVGNTSQGACIFEAGSIQVPDNLRKVKMLMQHDMDRPIGVLSELDDNGSSITATFEVPKGSVLGDQALVEASSGIRDGLSVGVRITEYTWDDNDNLIVKAAVLFEVSLVTIPAFENALVNKVAAARKEKEVKMETENAPVVEAAAPVAPAPAKIEVIEAQAPPVVTAKASTMTVLNAAQKIVEVMKAGGNAATVMAALVDVIPADDAGEGFLKKQAIGELWQASKTGRPMVEAFNTDKLTGLVAHGWKWDPANKPVVGRYAGNKTAVPSNNVKTVPAEGVAQDFAAGWDIARKYFDLGAVSFIESVFRMAVESYREQTDIWFGEQIVAAATPVATTSLLGALNTMNVEAAKIGSRIHTLQFGVDVWEEFTNLTEAQVPWWLKAQGEINLADLTGNAGGVKFNANTGLEGGQILGNDKNAATFYEAGTPVKVQALDIPRGGIDLGVFGYAAAIVHDPRAIFKSTVTA